MQLASMFLGRLRALSMIHSLFENGSDATARAVRHRAGEAKGRRTQVSNMSLKAGNYYSEEASVVTAYIDKYWMNANRLRPVQMGP